LALNSGTITDAAGNPAVLTLPSPGTSGSLGNAKALVIDTTPPSPPTNPGPSATQPLPASTPPPKPPINTPAALPEPVQSSVANPSTTPVTNVANTILGSNDVATALGSIAPERVQVIGAAVASLPPTTAQAFGAALGGAGAQAASALLNNIAVLPQAQVAAVASVTGSLPAEAATTLVTTLAALPPAQLAAVAEVAAAIPAGAATQVFAAVANLSRGATAPIAFAPPAAVSVSASGQETVSFDIPDDAATAIRIGDDEVAGVQVALTGRRSVVVMVKPGQVGRITRPKSGNWPDLALPVTSGKQAGLMPIFSLPADVVALTFEPAPTGLSVVQQGSLGGGGVVPLSAPIAITVSAPAGAAKASVGIQMPSVSVEAGETFAYLYSTGGGTGPGFAGYLRAPAEFDPPTLRQKWNLPIDETADVLFLPVALRPAFVQNFSAGAHIFSSSESNAADFGVAGPQFTTFTVVAPQVENRIYVFNPVTKGYGWINADEVGPSGPPLE
jgi:hypothetical protein